MFRQIETGAVGVLVESVFEIAPAKENPLLAISAIELGKFSLRLHRFQVEDRMVINGFVQNLVGRNLSLAIERNEIVLAWGNPLQRIHPIVGGRLRVTFGSPDPVIP